MGRYTPLLIVLTVLSGLVNATTALGEVIRSFDSEIRVVNPATLEITETIRMDFEDAQRRGIFRTIPYRYNRLGNAWTVKLNDIEVTDEQGNSRTTDISRSGGSLTIRIGDADHFVTGEHVYIIRYTALRAVAFFDGEPEVYWNITGDEWPFPIEKASGRLILPEGVSPADVRSLSFRGPPGATQPAEVITEEDVLVFTAIDLPPGTGLTMAARLPAGSVEPTTWATTLGWWIRDWWPAFVLPLLALAVMYFRWRTRGRDEEGGQAIPVEWDPPAGLSPAEVGTMVDEVCHTQDVIATIIDLAARGYLRIEEVQADGVLGFGKSDYKFKKLREPDGDLKKHEEDVLNGIFASMKVATLSGLRGTFRGTFDSVRSDIYESLTQRGLFAGNPSHVRNGYIAVAVIIFILGFFTAFAGIAGGWASMGIGILLVGVPILVIGRKMPARTRKGSISLRECQGFRRFLMMVERERLAEAHRQDPALFGRLLPFAMVLGVEDQWAGQFEGLLDAPPDWYAGSYGATGFHPTLFISSLGHGVSSMGSSLSAVPASSGAGGGSSGFSSGGGGGGFSGGGFGGGGGGSW